MDLLDLLVKIGVKDEATGKIGAIGDKVKGGLASAAKAGAAAIGAAVGSAVTGVAAIGKAALDSYTQYEQLVGGVDKLFQDASPQLQEYAANAYQTAQMSANQYMEIATSFSASLINSLGGDTQKAAEQADVAMRSMSDNVNTFGSAMEDVQNAYQGFAKQNYTMLDNLKLGYGGTKQEMERLISDANEYAASIGKASDLSIDSFSDIVTAIDLIQQKQHIAGTTAREAATTIEGSVNMAKAAWQNWVTELGKDNADMEKLTTQLVDSVTAAASNIVPRIAVIAAAAATALTSELPGAVSQIVSAVGQYAPDLGSALLGLFATAVQVVMQYAPSVVSGLVSGISAFLVQYAPELLTGALTMFLAINQAIIESMPQIIEAISVLLASLAQAIIDNIPAISDGAYQLISMLGQAIADYGPQILESLLLILASLVVAIGGAVGQFFDQGMALIQGMWDGAVGMFQSVADWFGSIGDMILGAVGDLGSLLWDAGTSVIDGFLGGLKGAWDGVAGWFSSITASIPQIKGPPVKDAGLLVENGELVMQGFARGIERGWASAEGALGSVAGRVQGVFSPRFPSSLATASAASVASPSGGYVIHVHGDVNVQADDADQFMQSFLGAVRDMTRLGAA